MSEIDQPPLRRLEAVAKVVKKRVFLQETLEFFSRYTPWIAVCAFPVILSLRLWFGYSKVEALFAVGALTLGWIITGLIRGVTKTPGLLGLFEYWDRIEGKKDLYSSAWSFESDSRDSKRKLTEGERLHVTRAMRSLPESSGRVAGLIQIPNGGRAIAAIMIVALAAVTILPRRHVDQGSQLLTAEMQEEADKQSERIKELAKDLEKLAAQDEFEVAELEKLRSDLTDAANGLETSEGVTANEVLEGLEARARATEKLAEKLGMNDNSWASEELIREMSQHADFANLATFVKDKNAESSATEADSIAVSLANDDLKIETRDRITTALERTYEAATEEDESKAVGERVGNASRKMAAQQAKTAAREFEELAKHFRGVIQREENRKKLEDLANKLRDAGSQISGSKLQKMQQLAADKGGENQQGEKGKGPNGLSSVAQVPMPTANPQLADAPQSEPGGAPQIQPGGAVQMPVPGMGKPSPDGTNPDNKEGQPGIAAPVPGQGKQDGKGQKGFAANQTGGQNGDKQQPPQGLMAPVPGMAPGGQAAPNSGASSQMASASGGDQTSSQAGNGGLEAGQGTAAMGTEATEAQKAANDATVVAQTNKNGESTMRAIEGQSRMEKAQLERQDAVANFISAEEQALDGKSLPMSRKDHVLRYFGEIRRHFEVDRK